VREGPCIQRIMWNVAVVHSMPMTKRTDESEPSIMRHSQSPCPRRIVGRYAA
jgi:hypothetical protein